MLGGRILKALRVSLELLFGEGGILEELFVCLEIPVRGTLPGSLTHNFNDLVAVRARLSVTSTSLQWTQSGLALKNQHH